VLRPVHERMPVILRPDDYERWLDPKEPPAALQPLLTPYAAELMESWPVGKLVISPKNETPACIEPAD
jgi:putative SOS response-associated peptidase YedK